MESLLQILKRPLSKDLLPFLAPPKAWLLFLFFISFFAFTAKAQNLYPGVYLSEKNFRNNKISFAPVKGERYKLRLNELLNLPTMKIKIGDSVFFLHKDSIYGYRDKESIIHRFYHQTDYTMLNPGEEILLYKTITFGGYKNTQQVVNYFFSISDSSPILSLTKWNLMNACRNDPAFLDLLDLTFKGDENLAVYDTYYKMYRINHLYRESHQIQFKSE